MWVVTGMAEITAVGIYAHYWFPDVPQWIPALVTLGVLYGVNLVAVKLFGELEFWFALIKIVAILALLVAGPLFLIFGSGEHAEAASVSNLWAHGGLFPTGMLGVVLALQMVMFAFQGVELLGVTAGEVEDPAKSLPKATNAVVWRILVFYIGALLVVMMLVPWTEFSAGESPFVMVFERMGFPAAALVINFVVITAAASSCNSGIFSTGRMLYTLAHFGQAPKAFGKVNRNHVPALGITVSVAIMLLGVVLNYFIPEQVFVYVTSVALVGTHLDLGHDHARPHRLPPRRRPRRGGAGLLPDAGRALHQLAASSPSSPWSRSSSASTTAPASRSTSPRCGSRSSPSATSSTAATRPPALA